jgi:hypothetical protein
MSIGVSTPLEEGLAMSLQNRLVFLVIISLLTACYEDAKVETTPSSPNPMSASSPTEGPAGAVGPAGPQGPQGIQGAQGIQGPPGPGCSVTPVAPNAQYPTGGAQVSCGTTTSSVIQNGINAGENDWKLIAAGTNYTEGAEYTLTSAGLTNVRLMTPFSGQRIDTSVFNWPSNVATQVKFRVKSLSDAYCVGGNGVVKLGASDPAPVSAQCTEYSYTGNAAGTPVLNRNQIISDNWIRLSINDVKKNTCINSFQNSPLPGFPGMRGYVSHWGVECLYTGGGPAGIDWQSPITSMKVEEADYSPNTSIWHWEIWAR